MYELRDKAYKEWNSFRNTGIPELRHTNAGLQEAFNAGWNARKISEYQGKDS